MKLVLETEGYLVFAAKNGLEAMAVLNDGFKPSLILLDLLMPVMDGWQFMEQLRINHPALRSGVPLVIMTAAAEKTIGAEMMENSILKKPFTLEALMASVQSRSTSLPMRSRI